MMKDVDLIQALRRMAPETGSLHCLGCGYENRCRLNGCAIIRQAVERLKELTAPPPNNPLTLDELKEMDGEPVWCAFSEGCDCNMIIQWHNSEFFRSFECGFLLAEEYGKSWKAYRRKSEEGTSVGN